MDIAGGDIGFGDTKTFTADNCVIFSSAMTVGRDRPLKYEEKNADLLENLEFRTSSERYFVGSLAINEGGSATFDKYNSTRHRVCLLTSLGLLAEQFNGIVVTGLPISDLHRAGEIQKVLIGSHKFELCGKPRTVTISQLWTIPQGVAAYFDKIMNMDGSVVSPYAEKRVGIIDIGEKTLDFCMVNKGISFVNKKSGSLDLGMHCAYLELLRVLQRKDITCLPCAVRGYLDRIPEETAIEYERLANTIVDNLSTYWQWADFDHMLIAGGGGEALFPYLQKRIDCELLKAPRMANARGYYKCAMAKLNRK